MNASAIPSLNTGREAERVRRSAPERHRASHARIATGSRRDTLQARPAWLVAERHASITFGACPARLTWHGVHHRLEDDPPSDPMTPLPTFRRDQRRDRSANRACSAPEFIGQLRVIIGAILTNVSAEQAAIALLEYLKKEGVLTERYVIQSPPSAG
jgi:hypothetical protein